MKDPIEKYCEWNSLDVNENANKYLGPTGYFSYLLEEHMAKLVEALPAPVLKLHLEGFIYVHKLPYSIYIPYCTGHSIARLLELGLRTPTISSKPARHFDTYVDHIANYLITQQHYFTGAQALSSVEWYAGPFIRRDGLTSREVKQNVQRLLFNLNYPTRIGMQTPFTNFTIALDAPRRMLREERSIYGGARGDLLEAYYEEAREFLLALAELYLEGDSAGQPFTFPIPTLMATAKTLWEDPEVFEQVFKTSSSRGSFYWLNTRVVDPDSSFAMCCRLTINRDELLVASSAARAREYELKRDLSEIREDLLRTLERRKLGGIWALPDITGSISVTTINLPRISLESRGNDDKFWELYDSVLGVAKLSGDWFRSRYAALVNKYPSMYSMIKWYLKEFPSTHFSTIGLVGLPEAAAIFLQDPKLWKEGSRREWMRAISVMDKMIERAVEETRNWAVESGVPWNVEEVPAESAAAKLALVDSKLHPELLEYVYSPDNPIYSSSIAPYYGSLELSDRIEVESMLQKKFTGGVMMHIFLGEEPDFEALGKLTKRLVDTDLVYWSYTPAITRCNSCGKTFTGLHVECPACGSSSVDVWSRIVGYYRPIRNWNPHRRNEFWSRKHYGL